MTGRTTVREDQSLTYTYMLLGRQANKKHQQFPISTGRISQPASKVAVHCMSFSPRFFPLLHGTNRPIIRAGQITAEISLWDIEQLSLHNVHKGQHVTDNLADRSHLDNLNLDFFSFLT